VRGGEAGEIPGGQTRRKAIGQALAPAGAGVRFISPVAHAAPGRPRTARRRGGSRNVAIAEPPSRGKLPISMCQRIATGSLWPWQSGRARCPPPWPRRPKHSRVPPWLQASTPRVEAAFQPDGAAAAERARPRQTMPGEPHQQPHPTDRIDRPRRTNCAPAAPTRQGLESIQKLKPSQRRCAQPRGQQPLETVLPSIRAKGEQPEPVCRGGPPARSPSPRGQEEAPPAGGRLGAARPRLSGPAPANSAFIAAIAVPRAQRAGASAAQREGWVIWRPPSNHLFKIQRLRTQPGMPWPWRRKSRKSMARIRPASRGDRRVRGRAGAQGLRKVGGAGE